MLKSGLHNISVMFKTAAFLQLDKVRNGCGVQSERSRCAHAPQCQR
jgi:hypothetical protein